MDCLVGVLTCINCNNIHVYSTVDVQIVWYGPYLLKNTNIENIELLLIKTESKAFWFDYVLIVIPVSECNHHQTLTKEQNVIFCDS